MREDIRWVQRLAHFDNAFAELKEAVDWRSSVGCQNWRRRA